MQNACFKQCCMEQFIYHDVFLKGEDTGDSSVCSLGEQLDAACFKRCHCLRKIETVIVLCFAGMLIAGEQTLFNVEFCN